MALATLSIDLEARLAKLQTGLDKAVRLAEKDAARMEKAFGAVKAVAAGIGGALAAGLSVAVVTDFVRTTVDGIDALNDFADAVGTSVENASALEDVAMRTGTSLDTVAGAAMKLNDQLSAAKPGSAQEQALKAIGLSAEELRRLDPAEALLKVSKALASYEDGADKARLVQDLFGKSAREVAPFLKDLAEQGELVAKVTSKQAAEAEAFNKQLFALQTQINATARDLSGPLVKGILDTIEAFKAGKQASGSFGGFLLDSARDLFTAGKAFRDAGEGAAYYTKRLRELKEAGGSDGDIKFAERMAGYYRRVYESTAPDLGQTDPRELARRGKGPKTQALTWNGAPEKEKTPRTKAAKVDRYVDPLAYMSDAINAIDDTDIAKLERLQDTLVNLMTLQGANPDDPAIAQALANVKKQLEEMDPAAKAAAESAKRLQAILDQTPTGTMGKVLSDIELINKAFADGAIDAQRWAEAVMVATDKIRENGQEAAKTDDFARELGLTFSSAFEDAIVAGAGLSDTLKALEQDIIRIITRQLVTEPLADWIGGALKGAMGGKSGAAGIGDLIGKGLGALGGDGGWLESLNLGALMGVSFDGGGYTGSGARAGGLDGRGGFMAMLHPQETVVDHTRGQSAASQRFMRVVNHFNFAGPVDRRTQQQVAASVFRAVSRASARNN